MHRVQPLFLRIEASAKRIFLTFKEHGKGRQVGGLIDDQKYTRCAKHMIFYNIMVCNSIFPAFTAAKRAKTMQIKKVTCTCRDMST